MLIIQDTHIVQGRAELPFEDTYRDDLVPHLGEHGAQLAFFGWAPHGGGQGYEATVLTVVEDGSALRSYQEALAFGPLSEVWTRLEASDHALESKLLMPTASGFGVPAEPTEDGDGPRNLFRLDTLRVGSDAVALAETVPAGPEGSILEVLGCFTPALGGLAEQEITVLSRIRDLGELRKVLGEFAEGQWSGTVTVDGLERRQVRLSRCAAWSPIR